MKPHQDRVVEERQELAAKIERLQAFVNGPQFTVIGPDERERLLRQLVVMHSYERVLGERIAAFV